MLIGKGTEFFVGVEETFSLFCRSAHRTKVEAYQICLGEDNRGRTACPSMMNQSS